MYKRCLIILASWIIGFPAFATPSFITIGAIYNTQGVQAPLDQPSLRGAQLAIEQINAKGGVLGKKLRLRIEEGNSKVKVIQQLAKKISSDKSISVVIGLSDNGMVKAAASALLQAGKVFITSGATSPTLLLRFPQRFFLAAFTDNIQAAAAAQFITKQMYRQRAIVLYQQNMAYARALSHYFIDAFEHFNGHVIYRRALLNRQLSATTLSAIKNVHANIIFLAAGPSVAPELIKQLRQAHIAIPIMGGDSFVAADITPDGEQIANDIYFTTHGYFDKNFMQDSMLNFIKAYKKKYQEPPSNIFAALGYDAVELAVAGMRKADSLQANKIAQAIKGMHTFAALTGTLDLSNKLPSKTVTVVKIIHAKARIAALIIPQYLPKAIVPLKQPLHKATVHL